MVEQLGSDGRFRAIIHFAYAVPTGAQVACMPNMREFGETMYHRHVLLTDDPRAVTCPACKKTDAWMGATQGVVARG